MNDMSQGSSFPIGNRSSFMPAYDITTWVHPETLGQCASVYIWLPTDSNENTFNLKVVDDGNNLQIKIDIPPRFLDMEMMHKRWLKSATVDSAKYHPKYLAYKTLVNDWKIENEDDLTATSIIPLPFPCRSNSGISNLAWSTSKALVVNIDLSRSDEDIKEHKKMKPFTID